MDTTTVSNVSIPWIDTLLALPRQPKRGTIPSRVGIYSYVDSAEFSRVFYEDEAQLIVMRADRGDEQPWFTLHLWKSAHKRFFFFGMPGDWESESVLWSAGENGGESLLNHAVKVNKAWSLIK